MSSYCMIASYGNNKMNPFTDLAPDLEAGLGQEQGQFADRIAIQFLDLIGQLEKRNEIGAYVSGVVLGSWGEAPSLLKTLLEPTLML